MKISKKLTLCMCLFALLSIIPQAFPSDQIAVPEVSINPFSLYDSQINDNYVKVKLDADTYTKVNRPLSMLRIDLPLPEKGITSTNLIPFDVITPTAKFLFGTTPVPAPTVRIFKGQIDNDPNSLVFLTISKDNKANGMIFTGDNQRYILSQGTSASNPNGVMTISHESDSVTLPDFPAFCGVEENATYMKDALNSFSQSTEILNTTTRLATLAIDGDLKYVELFDNATDAQNYAVQLIAAISAIYVRDFDIKLEIDFLRLWTSGGEPYDAGNLSGFANYWLSNENPQDYNIVHLLSGRRDLSFGGIAYLSGTCLSDNAFSISGYLNGSFPSPLGEPSQGNWDVIVGAHEMGHNFGTGHTHDDPNYVPLIDSCAFGVPTIGTIMSYCHTHPGYTANTDLRFHSRVIERVKSIIASSNCWVNDCNDNGIDDLLDISSAFSADINGNNIPDECEDCNGNGILDPQDIANGMVDIDMNGIPDVCEEDCNNNGLPDHLDVDFGLSDDDNFNLIPDECEADCNANGIIDYLDIKDGPFSDYDRNRIPDICQDCNNNGAIDWIDVDKQFNLFVGDNNGGYIREYHINSGVPITNIASGTITSCYDIVFDESGNLYSADFNVGIVHKIDVVTNTSSIFINDTNIDSPSALVIAPNGNLLVANNSNNKIFEYALPSGSFVGEFASASSPLSNPMGMIIGWDGNLYVSSSNTNSVLKFNGTSGLFISEFVTIGSGGLNSPRGIVFDNQGSLLVCSYNSNQILSYNGTTGAFQKVFSDAYDLSRPWDIAVGTNGDIYVSRSTAGPRIIEYDPVGRYYRSFVRGDAGMLLPTGIAFKPASENDCNGNLTPDDCDIASGFSLDANLNTIPDECESVVDADNDGVTSDLDCDDNNPNVQFVETYYFDGDEDGYGDANTSITICTPPAGYVLNNQDCNDSDPNINPLGVETCNGFDDDCNGFIDDGLAGADSDSDGIPDNCDICPNDPENDIDGDSICGNIDNCPTVSNPLQEDENLNGVGDACCCVGITGNVDEDPNNLVDISDLVALVEFIFNAGNSPACRLEANVDSVADIDISDLVTLVDFIFTGGGPLPNCP